MKVYRIGIAGAGFGATAHLPALVNHPRFEVVAIASPSSAPDVARRSNIPHAYRDCAEMLAGCELDAVTVASPPFKHHEDVKAALAAGKHVLAEKPFALNTEAAQEMAGCRKGGRHGLRGLARIPIRARGGGAQRARRQQSPWAAS